MQSEQGVGQNNNTIVKNEKIALVTHAIKTLMAENQKITIRKIQELSGVAKATVEKHYKEIMVDINQINNAIIETPISSKVPTSITINKFITNCKYKFGSYVDDYRFDRLRDDINDIWGIEYISEITEEIKNYINRQIDYPNQDGDYVMLQLLN